MFFPGAPDLKTPFKGAHGTPVLQTCAKALDAMERGLHVVPFQLFYELARALAIIEQVKLSAGDACVIPEPRLSAVEDELR